MRSFKSDSIFLSGESWKDDEVRFNLTYEGVIRTGYDFDKGWLNLRNKISIHDFAKNNLTKNRFINFTKNNR